VLTLHTLTPFAWARLQSFDLDGNFFRVGMRSER